MDRDGAQREHGALILRQGGRSRMMALACVGGGHSVQSVQLWPRSSARTRNLRLDRRGERIWPWPWRDSPDFLRTAEHDERRNAVQAETCAEFGLLVDVAVQPAHFGPAETHARIQDRALGDVAVRTVAAPQEKDRKWCGDVGERGIEVCAAHVLHREFPKEFRNGCCVHHDVFNLRLWEARKARCPASIRGQHCGDCHSQLGAE